MNAFAKIWAKKILCALRGIRADRNAYVSLRAEVNHPAQLTCDENVAIGKYARMMTCGANGRIHLGAGTQVYPYTLFKADDGVISVGKNCTFNDYCIIHGRGTLTIGDNVHIAARTTIIPMNHIYAALDRPICEQGISAEGITLGNDIWIGTGVIILDGVTIGDGCVIGAGAVVTKDIEPYSVAVGVPARVIRKRK